MSIDSKYRQRGFTLIELMIVIAIIFIVSAMAVPRMRQIIDQNKLQGSAQEYAGFVQLARMRAVQDDQFYQVLNTTTGGNNPIVFLDSSPVNGSLDAGELQVQLPAPVVITDVGAPAGFDTNTLLGATPLYSSTTTEPAMTAADGLQRAGLAFNGRGLPCQRYSSILPCTVAPLDGSGNVVTVAWVTYLKYTFTSGGTGWAAVTVTPAGRIKTWSYDSAAGSWK
jgi:prepilin-type N-terminal cleavage/methylation domain-containing protein